MWVGGRWVGVFFSFCLLVYACACGGGGQDSTHYCLVSKPMEYFSAYKHHFIKWQGIVNQILYLKKARFSIIYLFERRTTLFGVCFQPSLCDHQERAECQSSRWRNIQQIKSSNFQTMPRVGSRKQCKGIGEDDLTLTCRCGGR